MINHYNLKFTGEDGLEIIHFLDLTLMGSVQENKLKRQPFRKFTFKNSNLKADRCHPKHTLKEIPKGQFIRVNCNSSNIEDYKIATRSTLSFRGISPIK